IQRRIEETSPESLQGAAKLAPTEYVQRQIQDKALESLQEAVKLAPPNGLALARLARAVLAQEPSQNPRQLGEALWLTRRAVEFAPGEAEVLRARVEALERAGNFSEALDAMNAAIKIEPWKPELR